MLKTIKIENFRGFKSFELQQNQVVLMSEETLLQEALQTIEPKIQRIASISPPAIIQQRFRSPFLDSRGGFVVRLSDSSQRVPIGSMGDGIWRILGLALSSVCARSGFLFYDLSAIAHLRQPTTIESQWCHLFLPYADESL